MAIVNEVFGYKQISASGNVCAGAASLGGIFVSSSTGGSITVYDDSGTGTSIKMVDTFIATAGNYYALPFGATNGLYVVIAGTVSATVGFVRT